MAIYHLSMKPIARSSGRSAVAAAAYRAGECLTNERDGLTHDYTRKAGIEHAEIVLPRGSTAEWARDRGALWNAAEAAEKRSDARVAREFEIALPHELTAEERLEATRSFAQGLADRYGTAVDFAVHSPNGETDIRNHHAHLMMTVRSVGVAGLGEKTAIERENGWLLSRELPTSQMQLRDIRQAWEGIANEHLARAGHDLRVDHRSHLDRGLEIEPTGHMGVYATQMERRGMDVSRVRLDAEAAERNARLIRDKPEQVLAVITGERSVFDRHDIARALHRAIDEPEAFQNAFAKVMASPVLVELQGEIRHEDGSISLARYSTREMIGLEREMASNALRMAGNTSHGVDGKSVEAAIAAQDAAIQRGVPAHLEDRLARGDIGEDEAARELGRARLSDEQRAAVRHITGNEQIAVVVGFAGAGKSTMLAAAREAWEAGGYRVLGAALAGKAAEGLEESSGIASRTLASWEHGWQAGRGELGPKDVLVIDEAGMVSSRQLARFVGQAERAGAKLVMVGDPQQLQAIGAGAPFRAIAERTGFAELQEIRRQREDWQREASQGFARHQTVDALSAYAGHGAIRFSETRDGARAEIVRDYMADLAARPDGSRVAMAHRRVDVRALNADIRAARQERGELARGEADQGHLGREHVFQTNHGERSFATGDRVVFLENNRDLGVKNGMLGTVTGIEEGRITAELDGGNGDGAPRMVTVSIADYAAIDHGYATTIHKTQGATVDRSFVMASGTMDRHLTYVAMTRHRDGAQLYAGRDEFKNGMEALTSRLSRDGSKETTLDYDIRDFAERRGIRVSEAIGRMVAKTFETLGLPKPAFVERMAPGGMAGKGRGDGEEPGRAQQGIGFEPERADAGGIDARQVMPDTRTSPERDAASSGNGIMSVSNRKELAERSVSGEKPARAQDHRERAVGGARSNALDQQQKQGEERAPGAGEREVPGKPDPADINQRDRQGEERALRTGAVPDRSLAQEPAGAASGIVRGDDANRTASDRAETGQKPASESAKQQVSPERSGRQHDVAPAAARGEKSRGLEGEVPAAPPPTGKRGIFSGLRLEAGRDRVGQSTGERFAGLKLPAREQAGYSGGKEPLQSPAMDSRREQLLLKTEGYARAYADAARMKDLGLPVVEHQKVALEKASARLDAVHPEARSVLESSLQHDPETRRVMMETKGAERAAGLVAGMGRERQAQQDPNVRAERFATRWSSLEQEHAKLQAGGNSDHAGTDRQEARVKIETDMREAASAIGKDHEAAAILRTNPGDHGIRRESSLGRALKEADIGKSLTRALTKAIEQGLSQSEHERGQGHSM